MALTFRRRIKTGSKSWLNVSRSGVSVSRRIGPVTINSRGRITIRLGRGLAYRRRFR